MKVTRKGRGREGKTGIREEEEGEEKGETERGDNTRE
jgi:hypothetical protein